MSRGDGSGPSGPKPERCRRPSAPRNGEIPRDPRHFRQSAPCEARSLGIAGESSGFEGRALAVGLCRLRRRPGMGKRGPTASGCPAPRSVIASEPGDRNDGGQRGQRCATSEARSSSPGRAADGGNRADHRDNGSPGRALAPVRTPVRKIARRFHCHRNCANDRGGLMGDVRRADVFVRPA